MLHLKKINKTFGTKKVLDDISVDIDKGTVAVFLGPSGVGKSTLLRILNNLETVDSGSVKLNNKPLDLKKVNKDHTVAMVFQNFNLFDHLTAQQNITLPLEKALKKSKKESEKIARDLLTKYGLIDKADVYPSQLSGGQKQRLALARTLALKPEVICLDEPTSALDPLLTTYVANTIKELADQGYIVLVATHDTTLLEKLPCTIYLMKDGKIIESTSSQTFYANKSQFPRLLQFVSGALD